MKLYEKQICNGITHDEKITAREVILLIFGAAVFISICSKSSPLYPLNDWVDANCFFTVGKAMMHGLVPYRDLLEQKGPMLYFLHGLAYLVSNKTFWGVYFLEIIAAFFFLFFCSKIIALYHGHGFIHLISVFVIALITFTSDAFSHGDSAEELALPCLTYAVYLAVRTNRTQKPIKGYEYLILGFSAGCLFWIKFTMVGMYIGWYLVLLFTQIKRHSWKSALSMTGLIAAGVALSTVPWIVFFGANHALSDLFRVYFYNNIFLYAVRPTSRGLSGLSVIFSNLQLGFASFREHNTLSFILVVFALFAGFLMDNRTNYIHIAGIALTMFFFTYAGGSIINYYALIMNTLLPVAVSYCIYIVAAVFPRSFRFLRIRTSIVVLICLLCSALSLFVTPNRYLIGVKRSDLPQYTFAEYISREDNPTLLNYGFLDGGFYTVTGIVPNCKAFCWLNIQLEEQIQLQHQYVEDGLCDFVVTRTKPEVGYDAVFFGKYALAAEADYTMEGNIYTYRLFRLK